jgi:cytochrome c
MRKLLLLLPLALVLTGCIGPFLSAMMPAHPVTTPGDAAHGQVIFSQGTNGSPPCSTCHFVAAGQTGFSLGPNLFGVAERAVTRIEGVSAEEYLRQSILDPHSYVVSGFRDIMYPSFSQHFNEQDIQDLLAYLETLHAT